MEVTVKVERTTDPVFETEVVEVPEAVPGDPTRGMRLHRLWNGSLLLFVDECKSLCVGPVDDVFRIAVDDVEVYRADTGARIGYAEDESFANVLRQPVLRGGRS